jgi:hypothetical protein
LYKIKNPLSKLSGSNDSIKRPVNPFLNHRFIFPTPEEFET